MARPVMLMDGAFVCFEGIEGSGKSTQLEMLRSAMEDAGRRCLTLFYPDSASEYGAIIDRYLKGDAWPSVPELFLLFMADFAKDSYRIEEVLDEGGVVACSRYYYSTIAYQCASGFDYQRAKDLVKAVALPKPSVVFYMDVPVEIGYNRKLYSKGKAGLDVHEKNVEYIGKVRLIYEKMINEGIDTTCLRLDGTERAEELHKTVLKHVKGLL